MTKGGDQNGKQQDEQISYYESGAIESKAFFKDDEPHGEAIIYYESGAIQSKSIYNNDEQIGDTIYYTEEENTYH